MEVTQQILKAFLHYDEETGIFTRLIPVCNCSEGDIAGYENKRGYVVIGLLGYLFYAHRLAFLYMTGKWPIEIDHINKIRSDNRWCNLRECTTSENMNNKKNNIVVDVNGNKMCLKQACKLLNLNYQTMYNRVVRNHLTFKDASSK